MVGGYREDHPVILKTNTTIRNPFDAFDCIKGFSTTHGAAFPAIERNKFKGTAAIRAA